MSFTVAEDSEEGNLSEGAESDKISFRDDNRTELSSCPLSGINSDVPSGCVFFFFFLDEEEKKTLKKETNGVSSIPCM